MRRAPRLPARLIRWASLCVCFALILASLTLISPISSGSGFLPQGRNGQSDNGKSKRVKPVPPQSGAPLANLPSLDEMRQRSPVAPQARPSIPSTMRSRRKPLESRRGRKVGDPLPSKNQRISGGKGDRTSLARGGANNKDRATTRSHHALTRRSVGVFVTPLPQGGNAQNVTWMNLVGVTALGNNLTKTGGNGWDGGAVSTQAIASGDGYIETTISETSTHRMIGLSHGDTDQSYIDIDFAFGAALGGPLYVYENGNYRGTFGSYVNGDVLRVAVAGGVVKYKKNGTVLYTSTIAPAYPLLVDTSLYSTGASLSNVVISGNLSNTQSVTWTNMVGVSASGNSLTKTAADGWGNAGGSSTQTITSGNGYVEFTASETSTWRMCGLSHMDADQNYASIDFAMYPTGTSDGSHLSIYEGGAYRGDFGTYASGDHLRVAVESGAVKYSRNGTVIYTSTVAPTYPLLVDSSLYSNGSTVSDVVVSGNLTNQQNIIWTNVVGVSPSGNSLTKTAADGWGNAGASSTQAITSGDGYVEFTANETNTWRMCGLSNGDSDQNYTDIDFAIYPTGTSDGSHLYIYESGAYRGDFGPYSSGDQLRVAVESGAVRYRRNGTVFYTSTVAPSYPLLVDTSLYSNGSTVMNAVIGIKNSAGGDFGGQYTQNFIYWALAREPQSDELNYWEDIFRAAYAHQQGSMTISVREMARTMFESSDYAARGRNNHWYVYDLYKTYLMRNPETDGWAFWEGQCNKYGREQVRRAFDECGEFATHVAAIQPNGSPSSNVSSLLSARVDPNNQPGDQLLARDAEWGVPLLSLPGRAGLDLGLGLSYSSAAVWTRSGPYSYFDEDNGTLSPGFRLGFPTVQEVFFDAQVGVNAHLLITPAGHRVELRQVGASNVYEAADSSYLQLIDYGGSLLVRSTDGTRMSYTKLQDEWRCTQIEDRNGNYLTINNYWWGDIANITDTLGREITFNYDSNVNLISITQNWGAQSHPWATFGWSNISMQPGLPGVVGTHSGDVIPVLNQVALDDGSLYTFEYNANGQVNLIHRYTTPDYVQRSYIGYNYAPSADNSPRLTGQRVWAENWNGVNGVPNEVVTHFGLEGDQHTLTVDGDPNGTVYKESYGTGWQRGLTTQSEVWAGGSLQKTTTTIWVKDDNTPNGFPTNPRVIQNDVVDSAGNHSRTAIGYDTFTLPSGVSCSLPNDVYEYDSNATTVARLTHTDYDKDANYLNARVIGLPLAKLLYEGTSILVAKSTYVYDWGGEYLQNLPAAPTQHDGSYSTDFAVGRGNLVDALRWDITDPNNAAKALESRMGYDIDGSVIFTRDALNHQNSITYTDSLSDGNNSRHTFAYPTTATDADGFSSTLQYNFDFGAKTRVEGPPPANQSSGVIQTFSYDAAARLQQVTTANTGAYTRYVYGPYYVQSFSSVNSAVDDAYAVQLFDGAGHVFMAASYHPGSTGGYSAVHSIYDAMGRLVKQSNPTEMDGNWLPAGDDAAGWLYTQQSYDWKGRPLLTTHLTDGTTKQAGYSACGCAGSEVTTLTDEMGRQEKVYSDVLGRTAKTEVLDDNGGVYSTTANIYNGRDQVAAINTYNGQATSDFSCPTGTCMQSVATFDGYGRVATQKLPQQTAPTTYAYNSDDTVQSVTDPRGVVGTNTYNNRHLLTGVSYTPASGIDSLAPVSFGYDAVGNRTSMTDGTGSISYNYDQLSRTTSESRYFSGLGNSYAISYGYNLSGEMTSITDPSGAQVSYNYDSTGRLSSMPASGYNGVTNFLSNAQYRASGAMKHATYGNSVQVDLNYNSRMQIGQYQVSSPSYTMGATMSYYDDGRTNTAYDLNDSRFDRKYEFDFSARLKEAYSGVEAHGQPAPPLNQANSPYRQSYTYDQFNNATLRTGRIWSNQNEYDPASYTTDNKRQGWGYDAAGNATWTGDSTRTYDAAGRPASFVSSQTWQIYPNWPSGHPDAPALETQDVFDGTGQVVKHVNHTRHDDSYDGGYGLIYVFNETTTTTYHVHSTVLGGRSIEELDANGNKTKGYVYAGRARVATQTVVGGSDSVQIESTNPVTGATVLTDVNGNGATRQEPDPLGRDLAEAVVDPTVVVDPLSSSKWNDPMPIEASWGPSQEYLNANAGRAAQMDAYEVEKALFYGFHSTVDLILQKNPNVGIKTDTGRTSYGSDAADYLASGGGMNDELAWLGVTTTPQNSEPDQKRIRDNLAKELEDPDCAGFIRNLLGAVATPQNRLVEGGDLLKVWDIINGPGQTGVWRSTEPTVAWGSIGNHDGGIRFSGWNAATLEHLKGQQLTDSLVRKDSYEALHELIHLAGRNSYSDFQLALTASGLPGTPELKILPPLTAASTDAERWHDAYYYSNYWNTELRKHCKGRP